MIATKKAKLIRKHLGANTPEWIVKNCIALLKEYEEIGWCGVPENQANGDNTGDDKCHIQRVSNSGYPIHICDNEENTLCGIDLKIKGMSWVENTQLHTIKHGRLCAKCSKIHYRAVRFCRLLSLFGQ